VYDHDGYDVYLYRDFKDEAAPKPKGASMKLTRMDDVWGANSRRNMNRLFEKIEAPAQRAVDRRLWPMMFWLDVSWQLLLLGKK